MAKVEKPVEEAAPARDVNDIMEDYVEISIPFGATVDAPPILLAATAC